MASLPLHGPHPSVRQRTLLVRLDRIGDLVLTLPVDQGLGPENVHWWIPQGLGFVTKSALPPRSATEIAKTTDLNRFYSLWQKLRQDRYTRVIVFHAPWWVSFLVWLARIPVRVGVKSQWHSFLFFNHGVRQKRSRADHSELEFNYRLVEEGLGLRPGELPRQSLTLAPASNEALSKFGLTAGSYAVVHPGMSGSARNWPVENYAEFIRQVARTEKVVITGTSADADQLADLKPLIASESQVVWLDGQLSGEELIAVLAGANFVLAPSTGVAHLAASTGQPTIGIYSPVRVQRALRWGPQGSKVKTLTPDVACPGELSCLGPACPLWDCMPKVSVEMAIRAAEEIKA